MNALIVLSVAALAACGNAQYFGYPGLFYNYPGLYSGAYPAAVTLKAAPETVTLKTVAPAPLTYSVAAVAPVAPIQSQFHAQDEIGQYSFGYAGGPSSRAESRDAFGIVRGSYNYVDSEGKVQTQHYVADALGFRVSGTNLPVAPDAPEAAPLAALPGPAPEPVDDTPEVAAAKAAHQQAYDEAAAAAAAAPDSRKKRSIVAPLTPFSGVYSPLRFSYGFTAPAFPSVYSAGAVPTLATYGAHPAALTYTAAAPAGITYTAAAPAALKDAELLRIVHNPGHGTSYRVQ
ncbi:cuticle protein 19.8 [Penaeus vannamei]|uniref:cuticle protein 19.8 n=1 Tax=Penaeus vannamei TaxID=6689 RepID=UPI00387F6BC5